MGCEQKMMANGKNSLLRADARVRLNNLMKPNSSHISLRTRSAKEGNTHVKNGLLHEYLARRCTGVECFAQEAQSTTVCNKSGDGTSSWTEAPTPFHEQPSHRFTDMGCEHKMMANGKNSLLCADAGVRLNNLMKPNNSHISLRTWSAKEGNTRVKNGLLHEYLARRCTGVECFAQEAIYDCMQQFKGWNVFLDRGARTFLSTTLTSLYGHGVRAKDDGKREE